MCDYDGQYTRDYHYQMFSPIGRLIEKLIMVVVAVVFAVICIGGVVLFGHTLIRFAWDCLHQ